MIVLGWPGVLDISFRALWAGPDKHSTQEHNIREFSIQAHFRDSSPEDFLDKHQADFQASSLADFPDNNPVDFPDNSRVDFLSSSRGNSLEASNSR